MRTGSIEERLIESPGDPAAPVMKASEICGNKNIWNDLAAEYFSKVVLLCKQQDHQRHRRNKVIFGLCAVMD